MKLFLPTTSLFFVLAASIMQASHAVTRVDKSCGGMQGDECNRDLGNNQRSGDDCCGGYDCVYNGWENKYFCEKSRRALSIEEPHEQQVWDEHLDKCGEVDYSLAVHIQGHLKLLAQPSSSSRSAAKEFACKPFYMEDDTSNNGKKITLVLDDPENTFDEMWSESFPISNAEYELEQLAVAFEIAADSSGKEYDAVHNNCATFILSMLAAVGYEVDEAGMDFAVNRLAESDYIDVLLEAESLGNLGVGEDIDHSDTAQLMRALVEQYVAENKYL